MLTRGQREKMKKKGKLSNEGGGMTNDNPKVVVASDAFEKTFSVNQKHRTKDRDETRDDSTEKEVVHAKKSSVTTATKKKKQKKIRMLPRRMLFPKIRQLEHPNVKLQMLSH